MSLEDKYDSVWYDPVIHHDIHIRHNNKVYRVAVQRDDKEIFYDLLFGPDFRHSKFIPWHAYSDKPRVSDIVDWIDLGFPKHIKPLNRETLRIYKEILAQKQAILKKDNPGIETDV